MLQTTDKEYRYKYEREKLKRIALDVNKENEYIPFKDLCEKKQIAVSGYIRQLMKREVQYPGMHILDIISAEQYNKLVQILETKRKQTVSEWLADSIQKFIDKYDN